LRLTYFLTHVNFQCSTSFFVIFDPLLQFLLRGFLPGNGNAV
jgi:hypothetical protein